MTARDRLMLMGIAVIAVLLGVWFMAISPEREHASKVTAEVEAARAQLASAESAATNARNARANYTSAYTSLVSLGQAVPASPETPALIYQIDHASNSRDVQFSSISVTSSGPKSSATSSSGSSSSGSGSSATAGGQVGGFAEEPFTFIFNGSFVDLYKLLAQLESATAQTPSGSLLVTGRLLTINGVNLAPSPEAQGSGKSKKGELTGTITATAYVLPANQPALGNATPAGPSGTSASSSNSATTPAVIRANP